MANLALGVSSHSGWAVVVGVSAADDGPRIVLRARLDMVDPADATSKQPYHAVQDLAIAAAAERLAAYAASAEERAFESFGAVLRLSSTAGHRIAAIGILESAGRKGAGLAAILASHALLHTAEGDHFRCAVAAAADRHGIEHVARVPARELEAHAARALGRPAATLRRRLDQAARALGPPWGADQKAAGLLAWLLTVESQ